jgi:hypothetical protein
VKTLVAGAVAVLLGSAALVLTAVPGAAAGDPTAPPDPPPTQATTPVATTPPPSAPLPPPPSPAEVLTPSAPEITATCSVLGAIVKDLYATGGKMGLGWTPAGTGEPTITRVTAPMEPSIGVMFEPNHNYVSTAMSWRIVVWRSDGTIAWDEHGTTTPCPAPPLPRHAELVKPPKPPCGSTLDDVAWPSTPGVVYSHDQWNGYARLLPGWEWVNANFNAITGWWLPGGSSSVEATLVWLPRQLILNPTGSCGTSASPPANSRVDSPCWYGLAHPQPCPTPTPLVYVPSRPMKMSDPPTSTTFPVPPIEATSPARPNPAPAPTVAFSAGPTGAPSPAPSPSATPTAQVTPRVGTSTGLGVAGGLAGASMLAAAGAFVVRKRLRPAPDHVVLEEPGPDDSPTD